MAERTYTAFLKDREVKVTSQDLAAFRRVYAGDSDLAQRMSELLWLDIYVLDMAFGVGPHEVLAAIQEVEEGEASAAGVKRATQFKNLPLKGLWHKHYFSANFLVDNILLGLGKNGLERLVNEVMSPNKPIITQEMIDELARRTSR